MSEPLIPSEEWVTDPDLNFDENYDDTPCPACSALVENRAVHRAWHLAIFDLAMRYLDRGCIHRQRGYPQQTLDDYPN